MIDGFAAALIADEKSLRPSYISVVLTGVSGWGGGIRITLTITLVIVGIAAIRILILRHGESIDLLSRLGRKIR